jgi:ADP-ribose pyrophosphatase YjhB (NUDIX family)
MHEIAKSILQKLATQKTARYSELKDKAVEGNQFVYHLKSLIKFGYIKLEDKAYSLTSAGKHLIDRMSFMTFKERIQPKIVTIIVAEHDGEHTGKFLLYKRKRAPFIEHVGFPYGKIHLEERLQESAERELQEKTGMYGELKHRGDVYITVHDEAELVSHMLCHVFSGANLKGELNTNTGGECFWGSLEDFPQNKLIPGVKQIAKLLEKNKRGHFFAEYFLNTTDDTQE